MTFSILKAKPNGSCLFISLRLALEYKKMFQLLDSGRGDYMGVLDGFDDRIVVAAEKLRNTIIEWYSKKDKVITDYGYYIHNDDTPWLRGDVLALECANLPEISLGDIPQSGPERDRIIQKYIDYMRKPRTWGGSPEYMAFSFMSKLEVQVFIPQRETKTLIMSNNIKPKNSIGVIRLLFDGSSHYDLLLSNSDAERIREMAPQTELVKIDSWHIQG